MTGELKIFDSHDCKLPEMKFTVKKVSKYKKNFWGRKVSYEVEEKVYDHGWARFACECGAKWAWLGYFWHCQSRPNKWITVDS